MHLYQLLAIDVPWALPLLRRHAQTGPGRRTITSIMGTDFGRVVWSKGTYRNPNRRLPRKKMPAARRAEQLSRGRA